VLDLVCAVGSGGGGDDDDDNARRVCADVFGRAQCRRMIMRVEAASDNGFFFMKRVSFRVMRIYENERRAERHGCGTSVGAPFHALSFK
jgi:hypothetical protein